MIILDKAGEETTNDINQSILLTNEFYYRFLNTKTQ